MLSDILNIKEKDVISIVGSGGKTSLIMYLSKIISDKKICLTTTTKMYYPKKEQYDYILDNKDQVLNLCKSNNIGRYFIGEYKRELNKICSLDIDMLNKVIDDFDVTLIEADGSKRKLIKGWKDNEPVIITKTTKTIGIINLEILDKPATEENVHNIREFKEITNTEEKNIITINDLISIILDKKGLFKNGKSEKILFVNGVEGEKSERMALDLLNKINEKENLVDKYIYGSIKEKRFYEYIKNKKIRGDVR